MNLKKKGLCLGLAAGLAFGAVCSAAPVDRETIQQVALLQSLAGSLTDERFLQEWNV